ncbi:Mu transposase domain-containing protein [Corynebacterium canis]
MTALPKEPYSDVEYLERTVQRNICVQVDKHFYSVPYKLVGRKVMVKLTRGSVMVIDNNNVVATHTRVYSRRRRHIIDDAHRPPAHAHVKNLWTASSALPLVAGYRSSWRRDQATQVSVTNTRGTAKVSPS